MNRFIYCGLGVVFFTHMLISPLLIDETLDFYDIVIEECNGGLQT